MKIPEEDSNQLGGDVVDSQKCIDFDEDQKTSEYPSASVDCRFREAAPLSDSSTEELPNKACTSVYAHGTFTASHLELKEIGRADFNKNRKIIVRNIPSATYDEVKGFMGRFSVSNISISKRLRHAIVVLKNGGEAEEAVLNLNGKMLLNKEVDVCLYRNDNLLCVCNIPIEWQERDLKTIAEGYGQLEKCFIMRDVNGSSEGYGFVEFMHNNAKSEEVRRKIDLRIFQKKTIRCRFVKDHLVTFDQLKSKCLVLDNLPESFSNQQSIFGLFSIAGKPISCQVGIQNDQFLGFAIVEFSSAEFAEKAFREFDAPSCSTSSSAIQRSFSIPGESIQESFDSLITIKSQQQLPFIPPPPLPPLFNSCLPGLGPMDASQFMNPMMLHLLQQNPIVLENFLQIMKQLGQQQQQSIDSISLNNPGASGVNRNLSNPLSNLNLQISLLSVMLATQLQQMQPAFLTNPAAFIPPSMIDRHAPIISNNNPLITEANLMMQNLAGQWNQTPVAAANQISLNAHPLPGNRQMAEGVAREAMISIPTDFNQILDIVQEKSTATKTSSTNKPDEKGHGLRPILGAHGINPVKLPGPASPFVAQAIESSIRNQLQNLEKCRERDVTNEDAFALRSSGIKREAKTMLMSTFPQKRHCTLSRILHKYDIHGKDNRHQKQRFSGQTETTTTDEMTDSRTNKASFGFNENKRSALIGSGVSLPFSAADNLVPLHVECARQVPPTHGFTRILKKNDSLDDCENSAEDKRRVLLPVGAARKKDKIKRFKNIEKSTELQLTPGQKRSCPHFVPSPEPSPEGAYIGQHSQGIGGHYADSYFKRNKF